MWKIRGKNYDLTEFLDIHPGGRDILKSSEGLDNLTELFNRYHSHVDNAKLKEMMKQYEINESIFSIYNFIYHVIGLIYSLSILAYFILTIIFLSQDYSIYKMCPESHIWPYVLVGMIFLVPIFLIKKMYLIMIIEFPLMIWGMAELFQYDKCVELRNIHLWNIGLMTCIIEMLVCFSVILNYIFLGNETRNPAPALATETNV